MGRSAANIRASYPGGTGPGDPHAAGSPAPRGTGAGRPDGAGAPPPGVTVTLDGVGGTGLAVAAVRAQETARPDRLFADPLAATFAAAGGLDPDSPPGGRRAAALRVWVVGRTVFLDELLAEASQDGCRQVVLLGAGFDTSAFRLPWPPGTRCPPYQRLTEAMIADPAGTLPHYPMVSHHGGYPDGS
jgi:O-methyltransferase involved in polyketide biosynthesis